MAADYFAKLVALSSNADTVRPELAGAKAYSRSYELRGRERMPMGEQTRLSSRRRAALGIAFVGGLMLTPAAQAQAPDAADIAEA